MTFQDTLEETMRSKVSAITAKQYMGRLRKMGGKDFTDLGFLNNVDTIHAHIDELAPSTRMSYYSAVLAALRAQMANATALIAKYSEKVASMMAGQKDAPKHEKTEKQQEAMIPMTEIKALKKRLNKAARPKDASYDARLHAMALALYTDIPPRRNMDYAAMVIVKKLPKELDPSKNYYDLSKKEFVFNVYKTASTYGQQTIAVPKPLQLAISKVIRDRPLTRTVKETPLLADKNGSALNTSLDITRLLNRVFGRPVSSTALRHIYISDEMGPAIKKSEQMAKDMAHSVALQSEYFKE